MRNIFLEKSYKKCSGETIPRPFSKKNQNWAYIWINILKSIVTYRFSYAMRHNDTNKFTSRPHPWPCVSFSQNFDKMDSFLQLVLSIFILRNLIVRWQKDLPKRELVFCVKPIDLKHLRWSFSQKLFSATSRSLFFVKSSYLDVSLVP